MNRFVLLSALIILVFLASLTLGGIPKLINYQGMLSDNLGNPLNGSYNLTFKIYSQPSGGSALWTGTHNGVSVQNGLFNITLGSTNAIPSTLFDDSVRYLGITVGVDPELSPRIRLTSVGYAYRAFVADSALKATSAGSGGGWVDDGTKVRLQSNTDSVGIGTNSPGCKLHVSSPTSNFGMLRVENSNTGAHEATIGFKEGSDPGVGIWVAGVGPWGNDSDFVIGRLAPKFLITPDGNVGIGTTNPLYKLHVKGSSSATYLTIEAPGGYAPGINFNVAGSEQWTILYHPTYSYLSFFKDGVGDKMVINDNGNVGIGTTSPSNKLHIFGSNPRLIIEASSSNAEINLKNYGDPGGVVWALYKDASTNDLRFYQGGNKITIQNSTGNVGIGTMTPEEKLHVAGTVKCSVLKLTGGSDIAEPFDIENPDGIKAGMVLVIDPENPGELQISEKAYDRCVAGIISGAGGIAPGMLMGQSGTKADGEYPVAISGRVYCWVDASAGPIQPGDLLTTSDTPGYAMKVTDYAKAQGAILGKAMSSLEKGRGLVLVLVTLQ